MKVSTFLFGMALTISTTALAGPGQIGSATQNDSAFFAAVLRDGQITSFCGESSIRTCAGHENDQYQFAKYVGSENGQACEVILSRNTSTGTESLIFKAPGTKVSTVYKPRAFFGEKETSRKQTAVDANIYSEISLPTSASISGIADASGEEPTLYHVKTQKSVSSDMINLKVVADSNKSFMGGIEIASDLNIKSGQFKARLQYQSYGSPNKREETLTTVQCQNMKLSQKWSGQLEIETQNLLLSGNSTVTIWNGSYGMQMPEADLLKASH